MSNSRFAFAPVVKNVHAVSDEAIARLRGVTAEDMIAYTQTSFTAYVEWEVEANTMVPDCPWRTAWTLFELTVLRASRTATMQQQNEKKHNDGSVTESGEAQSNNAHELLSS